MAIGAPSGLRLMIPVARHRQFLNRYLSRIVLIAALGGYSSSPGAASPTAQSPLNFQLEELRSAEMESLESFAGSPIFLVFFEPRCSWCAKQIAALQDLLERCPGQFRAVALGVHSDIPGYRRFLRRAEVELPAYRASPKLQAAIGGVPATPYTLFLDAAGKPTHRLRGAIDTAQLSHWLAEQGLTCPESPSSPGGAGQEPAH